MKGTEEIRKTILSYDTKEVAEILESLDKTSIVLAKTYLMALSDRKRIEETKMEEVAV